MKITSWLTLAAIIILGVTLLVQKAKDDKAGSVATTETPSQTMIVSELGTEASTVVTFTLKTVAEHGKLLFQGVGGDIDGIINPDLVVQSATVVRIVLINEDGMVHDLFLPDFDVKTDYVRRIGDETEILLEVGDMQPGSYVYYCTLPGHRQAGQEGKLVVVQP